MIPQTRRIAAATIAGACLAAQLRAEFVDTFDKPIEIAPQRAPGGWWHLTGDGEATMTFRQADGKGVAEIDARHDRRNIWWAIVGRTVTPSIDLDELARPDRELRVEARIRVSAAPRRVNLSFNHSRSTDFHQNLMEYDIPDTDRWHVISLTTDGFDADVGDDIHAQLALMDWGREQYAVEIDYFKVEVVDPGESGPDLGDPLPYRPKLPALQTYPVSIAPTQSAVIDAAYPWVNFARWKAISGAEPREILTASSVQTAILRWDFSAYRDAIPLGWGALELTTESALWAETNLEEFGELRVVEVLGGDPQWERSTVTYNSFLMGQRYDGALNGQMIIDQPPNLKRGGKTAIAISPPALRRLFAGETKGLAIYAQGALVASFYADGAGGDAPRLYFNTRE